MTTEINAEDFFASLAPDPSGNGLDTAQPAESSTTTTEGTGTEGGDASSSTPASAAATPAAGQAGATEAGVSAAAQPADASKPAVPATTPTQQPDAGQKVQEDGVGALPPEQKATLDVLAKIAERLDSKEAGKAAEKPADKPAEEEIPVPSYAFKINDKLMEALYAEAPETRAIALSQLLQANNQTVHRMVMKQAQEYVQNTLQSVIPQIVESAAGGVHLQAEQRQVAQDFFGKYPELGNPALKPVVLNIAQEMINAKDFKGWTPEFRDTLATRVKNTLSQVTGAAIPQAGASGQPASAQAPATQPAAQPAAIVPTGAGKVQPGSGNKITDEILGLLG